MAKNAKKFYAVKQGNQPGIYESWADCQQQINGFSGAEYKSFPTLAEAKAWLTVEADTALTELPSREELFAYVDGSFCAATNTYGYGVVLVFSDGSTEEYFGSGNREDVASMRNVAGELKGAMIAMQYAVNHRFQKLTIFHDYEGIAKWATGSWKANLDATRAYRNFCENLACTITLSFQKVAAHTGVLYNERADILAKKGAGIGDGK